LIESYYRSWFGFLKPLTAAIYSSFSKELYDKLHVIVNPLRKNSPLLKEMTESTAKRYDHVQRLARSYGAEFVLIWQPMRWVESCAEPVPVSEVDNFKSMSERFTTVRHNFVTTYAALSTKLEEKPYFVSIQNSLCHRKKVAFQPDGVHLTREGNEMIARRLSVVMMERFFSQSQ